MHNFVIVADIAAVILLWIMNIIVVCC